MLVVTVSQEKPGNSNPGRWKPGQSGNPSGRPKGLAEIQELARGHCPKAIEVLARILNRSRDERCRLEAAKALLDRAYGKPAQLIGQDRDNPWSHLSDDEVQKQALALMAKVSGK